MSWNAYDLGSALIALDSIYSTFLLARHLAVNASKRLEQSVEQWDRYLTHLEGEEPFFLAHEWHRLLRRYGPSAVPLIFPFVQIPGSATESGLNDVQKSEIDFCLQNL